MLSRAAANLYWIGRYMERADFTTRLTEATVRLGSLAGEVESDRAWHSALAVVGGQACFAKTGEALSGFAARRFLMLAEENASSVRTCLFMARDNARAARTALSREAWEAVNRSWLAIRDRASPGGTQATLNLVELLKAELRGFEGALTRMLRADSFWFMRLGSVIERADNTARLLDVKYYLLLPEGAPVGGTLDRDQWTTILHTVAALNAYRAIYREAIKPWLIADLLIFRRELPRSLAASADETVDLLSRLAGRTGRQGEADRLARQRLAFFEESNIEQLFQEGMHEQLRRCIAENNALDAAIAQQFRFG